MSIYTYTLTEAERQACTKFSNQIDVDYYSDRSGQNNEETKRKQQMLAKSSEYAVANYFFKIGWECTEPDIAIYSANEKSYSADLIAISKKQKVHSVAVKSIGKAESKKYGISWVFQQNDNHINNPEPNDLIALCITSGYKVEIVKIMYVKDIHGKFKPTKMNFSDKKAIYLEDL